MSATCGIDWATSAPSHQMVVGWLGDGKGSDMAEVDKSEKITINVGLVDLGQIDLLVDEGFYANRTDFIRTAIRRQLESRADAVNNTVKRRALVLGTASTGVTSRTCAMRADRRATRPRAGDDRQRRERRSCTGDDCLGRGPWRLAGAEDREGGLAPHDQLSSHTAPTNRPTSTSHTEGFPWTTTAPPACPRR